jgi:redox-sensitive bicupin YhaK (pirin superfamily)
MSHPEDHLLHTGGLAGENLALSTLTGLDRLNLVLHRLQAGEALSSPAGRERFVYVLEGSAELQAADQAGTHPDSIMLNAGDFAALTPEESADLSTDHGITILLGQSGPARRA